MARAPSFARARGFRLYDAAGRRYLDLWLAGGEALLGHRPRRVNRAVCDALARGLAAGLPTPWQGRLARELERWLPGRTVRIFSSRERAFAAAARWIGRRVEAEEVPDPAVGPVDPSLPVALWRPLAPAARDPPDTEVLLPVLPWTLGGAPAAACFASRLAPDEAPSDSVPAPVLAGAVLALSELRQSGRDDPFGVADFDRAAGWIRRGPYLAASFGPESWDEVAARFLDRGALLPPAFPGPAILPAEASEGERRMLAELFRTIPGG